MRWIWLLLLVLTIATAFSLRLSSRAATTAPITRPSVSLLSPDEFAGLIGKPDHVLLDVRTPEEHAALRIPGQQQLIDFETVTFAQDVAKLPRDCAYLVYCRSGRRSHLAVTLMQSLGFSRVVDLQGGIIAWQKAGKPVDK